MNKYLLMCGFIAVGFITGTINSKAYAGTYESCSAQYGEYQSADMSYQWAQSNLPFPNVLPYRRDMVQKRRSYELCMMH